MAPPSVTAAFERLLPREARWALAGPLELGTPLYPEEEVAVANAVEKRQQEFRAGRACARRALSDLGIEPGPIPVLANRGPRWPEGIVGSITHCRGLAAAAVAWRRDLDGIGLDAEVADPLSESLLRMICTEEERSWMADRPPPPGTDWGKLFFSAKEAVYKAIAPQAGQWIGFHDVLLDVDLARSRFSARSADTAVPRPELLRVRGTCAVEGGLVLTAAVVPAGRDGGLPR